jgi:hypothetical protein
MELSSWSTCDLNFIIRTDFIDYVRGLVYSEVRPSGKKVLLEGGTRNLPTTRTAFDDVAL